MYIFHIPKMSCGGCASTITDALKQEDRLATVHIDLTTRIVKIDSEKSEADITAALTGAGYPPAPLDLPLPDKSLK